MLTDQLKNTDVVILYWETILHNRMTDPITVSLPFSFPCAGNSYPQNLRL